MALETRQQLAAVKAQLLTEASDENDKKLITVGFAVLDEVLNGCTNLARIAAALEKIASPPAT